MDIFDVFEDDSRYPLSYDKMSQAHFQNQLMFESPSLADFSEDDIMRSFQALQ
jgi:hypothetical protein